MDRRKFLKTTIPSVLLPTLFGGISLRAFAQSPFLQTLAGDLDSGRVLVLIQLNGGNDGLNTVVPLDHYDAYMAARGNIAIPQAKLLSLNGFDHTALNPAMTAMQQLFNEGKLSIVQSVSYPQPNFSHFRATDIWLTGADTNQVLNTGWAGRYLNNQYPRFPEDFPNAAMPDPLAVQVGSIVSPALQGPGLTMGMAISNPTSFYNLINGQPPSESGGRAGELLGYIREMSVKTDQYAGVIKKAAQKVTVQSSLYPQQGKNPLADQLKIVSRMIAGGLQTKIYMVNLGSFDTHARQTDATDTTTGAHARLLGHLSEAIGAFMDDLQKQQVADRVIGMTFSEFGRRIKSNASGGTDHGAGAPVFIFGGSVQGGILGNSPVLPHAATVNDNIPMQYDFRSLYATLLERWFSVDPAGLRTMLLKNYQSLPLVQGGPHGSDGHAPGSDSAARAAAPSTAGNLILKSSCPSFSNATVLTFSSFGGHTMVQVFDTEGRLVAVPYDQDEVAPGNYSVAFNGDGLPAGTYYARLQNGVHQQVVPMEKEGA
jgi:uncharacterized protein (DUF1501 family)